MPLELLNDIRYTSLRRIGGDDEGENSEVHEIFDPQLGGTMVAKEIDTGELDPSDFFSEAKIVYAAKHENIVPIQYACRRVDKICLVMPLFARGSVARLIRHKPITPGSSVRIAIGVLAALGHIHAKGLVHLDVKPSNVLLSDAGVPMLSDFGESRLLSPIGTVRGPRMYLWAHPPEMYEHGVATVHSDIYQAGLLLYRMLNGEPFWAAQWPADHELTLMRQRTLKGKLPDRNQFCPHVPRRLRTLVRKALQVDPARRFNTAAEFRAALGRVHMTHDWAVEHDADGLTRWRATRSDQPDLLVERRQSNDHWNVDVMTARGQDDPRPRGRGVARFRRTGLDAMAADKHLNEVFRSL